MLEKITQISKMQNALPIVKYIEHLAAFKVPLSDI